MDGWHKKPWMDEIKNVQPAAKKMKDRRVFFVRIFLLGLMLPLIAPNSSLNRPSYCRVLLGCL